MMTTFLKFKLQLYIFTYKAKLIVRKIEILSKNSLYLYLFIYKSLEIRMKVIM